MIRTRQAFLPFICCLLTWNSLLAQDVPTRLNLVVLQGEGAADRAGEHASVSPSVRVEDQNHMPVSNAAVIFTLPTSGPTGEFDNGGKTLTVFSNDMGVADAAAVHGFKVNDVSGKMQILVNVAYRGQTASTIVTQFIVAPNGAVTHHSKAGKVILILALVAGGAAGAILATRKSGSSSSGGGSDTGPGGGGSTTPPSTIVLTVGPSSVGAPH
jgi:hypothetical protein